RASVDGAHVSLDGKSLGPAPLKGSVFVEPGHRVFTATREGYEPARSEVDVKKGASAEVSLELVAKEGSGGVNPVVAGIGFGLGAATGIVAGVLGGMSASKKSREDELAAELDVAGASCPSNSTASNCVELRDVASAKDTLQNAAVGLGIAAGVLTVGSIIYTAVAASQSAPAVAVVPWADPQSGGLALTGSF
ncbi:MAG: PEGA domain-containing protein, partial [Acidobacteria bacterium]|nr:PEGA domain-containing protein [Acidobacteriota bacterium]